VLTLTIVEEDPIDPGYYIFDYTGVDAGTAVVTRKALTFTTGTDDTIPIAVPIMAHNCKLLVSHATDSGVVTVVLRNGVSV
jgi:hypothetical protein